MRADAFSQKLLDDGLEWILVWQLDALKRQSRGIEAAIQGAGVVCLRRGDLLILDQMVPEILDFQSLLHTNFGQLSISPCYGAIAVKFGPIAIPGGCAEIGLSGIVKAFTMAGQE